VDMKPSKMPQHKPCRYVKGRYSTLVRKWSPGEWRDTDKR